MVATSAQRLEQTYPATKVMFMPSASTAQADLIATSSDGLRLWHLTPESSSFQRFLDVCFFRLAIFVHVHAFMRLA